ncbi:TPA: hypothetical protein ACRZZH_003129 [Vibrio harveyi]
MAKKLTLKIILNNLSLCLLFILMMNSFHARSSQLNYKFIGNKLIYTTAIPVNSIVTTASWTNVLNNKTAYSFQPGQLNRNLGINELQFVGDNGTRFRFDIDIKGLFYGGIDTRFARIEAEHNADIESIKLGNQELLNTGGVGQFSNYIYQSKSDNTVSLFKVIKPVFSLESKKLSDFLITNKIESGRYRASLPLAYQYRVQYAKNAIWTYEVRTFVFNIEIDYTGRALNSISVSGDGVIIPSYSSNKTEVIGETSFNVRAEGMMPDGISMRFLDQRRDYNLKMESFEIPYSIACKDTQSGICKTKAIVQNGKYIAKDEKLLVVPTKGNETDFTFELMVNYSSGYIKSGTFTDTFVVMFEVEI